ncbi:MAG: M23 family metallopeptidase [candidate division SR1 bacterium]|nr:M23 family metallopeptidase [candidate division SR1 bacterium]
MQICHFPIPTDKRTRELSKYTANIYKDDVVLKLEKVLGKGLVNQKWPEDLRAKPELLEILSLGRWKKFYIDLSPITHREIYSAQNAKDFLVPIGTPVLAANAGMIDHIETGNNGYGMDLEKYGKLPYNHIRIKHGFGSYSEYGHSNPDDIYIGMKVEAGQPIGYTCASGMMDLPHLHFNNYNVTDMGRYLKVESKEVMFI